MRRPMDFRRGMLASLMVLLVPIVAFRPGPVATAVSGSFTLTYTRPSVANGINSNGSSVFISRASGSNRNTDGSKYLAGARVVNVDTAAMVNGNGTHRGTATFTEGTSTVVKRFTGATSTKIVNLYVVVPTRPDAIPGGVFVEDAQKPESTFKGTWTIVRGTGKYAGITGNGTYSGRFETATKYTVGWKGSTSM